MKQLNSITTLFLDIGGVLLSNGWGHAFRSLAAKKFKLDLSELESRHSMVFVSYEEGKFTLSEYLKHVVFYEQRSFTQDQFRDFMFAQTTPFQDMIDLIQKLKEKYRLKIAVVSNEARDLNYYRIHAFKLNVFVDFFISSCFVHLRKPDADIFRIALDIAQVPAEQVVYIEDIPLFIEVAADMGIKGIRHTDYSSTVRSLAALGLKIE